MRITGRRPSPEQAEEFARRQVEFAGALAAKPHARPHPPRDLSEALARLEVAEGRLEALLDRVAELEDGGRRALATIHHGRAVAGLCEEASDPPRPPEPIASDDLRSQLAEALRAPRQVDLVGRVRSLVADLAAMELRFRSACLTADLRRAAIEGATSPPSRAAVYAHCEAGGLWVVAVSWPQVSRADPSEIERVVRARAFDDPALCCAFMADGDGTIVRAVALDATGAPCAPMSPAEGT